MSILEAREPAGSRALSFSFVVVFSPHRGTTPLAPDAALFPVFLKLAGLRVLVVGGGPVATSKLEALLAAGAHVRVVAPDVTEAIAASGVQIERRPFEHADLDSAWFVVAAATPDVNADVARAAQTRHVFVNAVDDPANATAYLGGVVRRSGATIAISTSGRAPALAGLLREGLDELLPADLDAWFAQADVLKQQWRSTGVPMVDRRPQLVEALAGRYCGTMPSCPGRREEPL
jgi:uroporphyrin-III C-methyltransferase / precorrin-2 dehydrogenase / sirohydrochlorin ferrochelatase